MSINVDGVEPPPAREAHMVDRATVGPGFFDAPGVKILRGRNFNERDLPYAPQAAIINQALADKFFVGRDALGRHSARTRQRKSSCRRHREQRQDSLPGGGAS